MSRIPTRPLALGAACAVAGLSAGSLLTAGAAAPPKPTAKAAKAKHRGGALARAVHAEATIPTKAGFKTVTVDRGVLTKADGSTLTLRQGGRKTTRTVQVEVPAGAKVRRAHTKATLADLRVGDRVAVLTGLPKGAVVRAAAPRRTP